MAKSIPPLQKIPNGYTVKTPKDLGVVVRKARKEAELTREQAAALCNGGRRFFVDLETGKQTLSLGLTLMVLRRFGITVTISQRA